MYPRKYSLTRAALHGITVFGILFAAAASATPAFAAPTNDNIGGATKITPAAYSATIADVATATTAGTDPVISCGASQHEDSVWYWFTPASSGEVSINTLNSQYDTVLAVFKNDPLVAGGLIELGCNDNASGTTSALVLPLRGGVRYFIEVVRKTGTTITATADMHINYSFATKVVAWGEPLGKKWDSTDDSLFKFSTGWQVYGPLVGAYKNAIHISNNVNNTAVTYFDGGSFDLYYARGPQMGTLEVYVDDVFQVGLGQGNATYVMAPPWSSPAYSDRVHKLTLKHSVGSTKVNFDYITVYSFPDVIAPAKITTLAATTSVTTGKVTLKWKAPGDDGNVGTATSYELRYFVDPPVINCVADWASGTPYITGLPAPAVAGTVQQITLGGLVPGFKYYFCLAAMDEVGNMGAPSNRASAVPTAGVPFGTGTYDDKHPGWTYVGNWKLINNPDARYNTLHVSTKINDTAAFSFTGDQFVFTYMTSAAGGLMDVYIDGIYVTTINQYTFYPNSFYYTSPILAYGPHVVRFVHMTQIEVTVDQIYVWRSNDGGPPDPIVDLLAVPGTNDGDVDLTWTATGDDPGGVGTAHHYEIRYSTNPITNAVEWDYAEPAAVIFTAPQAAGLPEAMTVEGLTPGAHYYFAVRASDNAYYDILSNTTDSDVQYTGAYAPAGYYEDNHSGWEYITALLNGWRQVNDVNATAGHYRRIANAPAGSMARFWFTGTRFQLLFQKGTGYGKLDVYVDGTKVGTIDQYYATTLWKRPWTSPILVFGNHVVEFRVIGTKANIDRIRIFP